MIDDNSMIILIDKERNLELVRCDESVMVKLPLSGEDLRFRNSYGDWNKGIVSYIKYVTAKGIIKIYLESVKELVTDI